MTVRIGVNPIVWSNDDMPELGGDIPLEVCLSEAREAGYEGIELGNKFPRQANQLAPLLERHGLLLVSGWYSARLRERTAEAEIAAMVAHQELLVAMGCDVMIVAEVSDSVHSRRDAPLSTRPRIKAAEWQTFARRLTEVAKHLDAVGLRMAYHPHMGTVVQTAQEVLRLLDCTGPGVGLTFDTGHLMFAGDDVVETLRACRERVVHLHLKDVRPEVLKTACHKDLPFLQAVCDGVFTVPGDGCIDFDLIWQAGSLGEFKGWVVVEAEQDPNKARPSTYAAQGHRHTARLLQRSA